MGKFKKNKKPKADSVYAKKSVGSDRNTNPFAVAKPTTSKLNPFEVHVNKEKFKILGRTCKHDKGLPGVSRAKAQKKRKETLGIEFMDKYKNNQFRDRRIAKHMADSELTDEVLNARFLADKMAQLKDRKASKFDLNDDVVLTHRGETLAEIEQFRDDRSDDDDEDNEILDANFTEAAHFGGGGETQQQVKDRKTAIEEMIVEQKKRKLEIAKEKDALHDLTQKLDSNYKDLVKVIGKYSQKGEKEKAEQDDFDKVMREMIFDRRGVVSDKLESEEDIAKKEKERLDRLEKERIKRMQGDGEEVKENNQQKHRSADDLDDGYFAYGNENNEGKEILAYNLDGKLGGKNSASDEGNEAENHGSNDEEGSGIESSDEEEETEDDLSDLKVEDSEAEDEEEEQEVSSKKNKSMGKVKSNKFKIANGSLESEIPYTIDLPSKYEGFLELISPHTPTDQMTIVERIIKCNHPKLDGVNRENVVKLFAFLLQYINELFVEADVENIANRFEILDKLTPQLYDLIHLNPEKMSSTLLDVIKQKYSEYRKRPKVFPSLDVLIFFKLVSNLFTTSDFRHPVVTPCFIFMEHILQCARLRTRKHIASGLFLVTIVMEYTQQSKRFLPASFNFMLGILFLCVPKRPVEQKKIIPPFQSKGPLSNLLVLSANETNEKIDTIEEDVIKSEDFLLESITDDFKIRTLNTSLKMIREMINIVADNVGSNYLAQPLLDMMESLPLDLYPDFVKKTCSDVSETLKKVASKTLTKLMPPEKKPKALRLLEPRIETIYDDKRRPKMSEAKTERAKLIHKIKREKKGAMREIRRDTQFLQNMRIEQQIRSDKERMEKVKRIYQEASAQQGELNELARAKKKSKF